MTTEYKICVTTWALYNEGVSVGTWYDMETFTSEEILEELKTLQVNHGMGEDIEDFCIDSEGDFIKDIDECTVNEAYGILELTVDNVDNIDAIRYLVNYVCMELDEAIEKYEDVTIYSDMDLNDVAYEIIEDCYNLDEFSKRYFDYEAFGRDLGYDGYNEIGCDVYFYQA